MNQTRPIGKVPPKKFKGNGNFVLFEIENKFISRCSVPSGRESSGKSLP